MHKTELSNTQLITIVVEASVVIMLGGWASINVDNWKAGKTPLNEKTNRADIQSDGPAPGHSSTVGEGLQ